MPRRVQKKNATGELITQRALNRALLARQFLLERTGLEVPMVLEHLVGLQSQAPIPPYFGLWSRLARFEPENLSALIRERKAVRIALMRGTLHVVTARDGLTLRPLVQPVHERSWKGTHGKRLVGLDLDRVAAAGRSLIETRPLTSAELGEALHSRWPKYEAQALAATIRTLVPLVQVPPRGLWGESGQATVTSAEAWLGQPLDTTSSLEALFLRYLGAFGPASVKDAQAWSGLTRLAEVAERLRPKLLTFQGEDGRELFDLPEAPRPAPEKAAPVRFIAEWDNLILSHADRTRVLSEAHRERIFTPNGIFPGTFLVDGFVHGTWALERERSTARLRLTPFAPLSRGDKRALSDEGTGLLRFAAAEASKHEVLFATV